MSKARFPRLRKKGKSFYFDTQRTPRYWVPLGSDIATAMAKYRRLIAGQGAAGTVARMLSDYIDYLASGGRGTYGRKVAKSTLEAYRVWARHIGAIFGHMQPAEITQGDIALYLHRCKRTGARGEISVLSSAYQHAMVNAGLTFNPCIGVKSTKPRSRRDRYITDAELVAVRDNASPLLQVAIDLAYLTGLRISDLLSLRWDQFKEGGIIENRKTGIRQHFVVTDDLRAVLDAAHALQGRVASLYVLAGRGGQPLNRQTVGVWWRKACAAAGVTGAVWHDLRAKAGTDVDAAGSDAQKLLGHTSAQTTRTYLRGKRVISVEPVRRRMR